MFSLFGGSICLCLLLLTLKIPISQMIIERISLDGGGVEFIKRILHDEISSSEMKSGFKKL